LSFWAKGELNSKGVAVLSRRNLDIAIRKVEDGGDGRFLRLDCLIYGQRVCIVNVYLPNDSVERRDFIKKRIAINIIILTVDQAKAFDRVEHCFLHNVFEKFGFGPDFRTWIRLLYTDISSKVLVNRFFNECLPCRTKRATGV
jgi:hypothetical protein